MDSIPLTLTPSTTDQKEPHAEIREMDARQQNDIPLLTDTDYLLRVKFFTDDLAWAVQCRLHPARHPNYNTVFSRLGVNDKKLPRLVLAELDRDFGILEKISDFRQKAEWPELFSHIIKLRRSGKENLLLKTKRPGQALCARKEKISWKT